MKRAEIDLEVWSQSPAARSRHLAVHPLVLASPASEAGAMVEGLGARWQFENADESGIVSRILVLVRDRAGYDAVARPRSSTKRTIFPSEDDSEGR